MIQSRARKWAIFASTSLLLFLMNFDMTAVNLALAPIARELHLNIINVEWIVSAYLIGGAALVMLGGLLGDVFGHRKVYLIGATIFSVASLGVGLASSEWVIILMRLFQGFGAAFAWPLAIVIVRETFSESTGLAMGLIAGVMAGSMSIGPPLGGVILHYLGWRWIFLINIPLGGLVILAGYLFLTKDKKINEVKQLHLPSAFFLVVGLLLFIFALNEIQRLGIKSPLILASLSIGMVFIIIFIMMQNIIKNPLIDLSLFKNIALTSCFIVRFLWQLVWIGTFLVTSLLFQNILGYTVLQTSIYFLVATSMFAIVSPLGGKLSEIFSTKLLINTAFILYIATFIGFALMTTSTSIWILGLIFVFFGIGTGIGFPALLNVTLTLAPADRRGMVSGTLYASLFGGGSVGAILVGLLINAIAPKTMLMKIRATNLDLSYAIQKMLIISSTGVRDIYKLSAITGSDHARLIINMLQRSFMHAFTIIMYIFIGICIIAFSVAFRIKTSSS